MMNHIHEDKEKLQGIIQAIGNTIASILPDLWSKVVIGYFVEEEGQVSHFQVHTITVVSEDYIDLMEESWDTDEYDDAIIEAQGMCKEMRTLCVSSGDSWTSMTFSLRADGTFEIEYGYEPIEEYDAQYILKWQSRYLN